MPAQSFFFYLFAALAIGFALLVVLKRNPVASAFSLVMVFFSFAGIYATLGAHLVAALQILVYAGAVMVLFIFVIMLINADTPSLDLLRTGPVARVVSGLLTLVLFAFFVWSFKNSAAIIKPGRFSEDFISQAGGNTQLLSELMFSEWILPFELTSVLLLAGIVGAVALSKRSRGQGGKNA